MSKPDVKSRPPMTLASHHPPRCRAHNRRGEPCGLAPIHGGVVCQVHGGRAPQVKAAAADRIAAALDDMLEPALVRLRELIDEESGSVALGVVKEILDRHIGKPKERVESAIAADLRFTLNISRGDDDDRD